MYFYQNFQFQRVSQPIKLRQMLRLQYSRNQQNRVCPNCRRLKNLILFKQKILSQNGNLYCLPNLFQIL